MTADAAFKALAEPNRRRILQLIRDEPLSVNEITAQLEVSQQAVSLHLKALHAAGLVTQQRERTRHLYVVRPDGFEGVREFIEQMWPARLSTLKHVVETNRRQTRR